ncbi:hypothetical protein BSKO_11441 [Bryopsis sp. KO-2023]|nr:hypothetical protein BSKO_11441 [Bryopsis sp. KO-2023]
MMFDSHAASSPSSLHKRKGMRSRVRNWVGARLCGHSVLEEVRRSMDAQNGRGSHLQGQRLRDPDNGSTNGQQTGYMNHRVEEWLGRYVASTDAQNSGEIRSPTRQLRSDFHDRMPSRPSVERDVRSMDCMRKLDKEKENLQRQEVLCAQVMQEMESLKAKWLDELSSIQQRLEYAVREREENESLLQLHQSNQSMDNRQNLAGVVREVKNNVEVPEDLQVMVDDILESRHGLHNKACVVCMEDFTAEDLLSAQHMDRCRHALYPCGHSVLCGVCAKKLWFSTRKCPLCRTEMTKKPRLFKPGRWQLGRQ